MVEQAWWERVGLGQVEDGLVGREEDGGSRRGMEG